MKTNTHTNVVYDPPFGAGSLQNVRTNNIKNELNYFFVGGLLHFDIVERAPYSRVS